MKKFFKRIWRKIEGKIWKQWYLRFRYVGDVVKVEAYWPTNFLSKEMEVNTAFIELFQLLQQHPSFTQFVRNAIIKFGVASEELVTAIYLVNLIDGMNTDDALQMAVNGLYNEMPPQPKPEVKEASDNDDDDEEEDDPNNFMTNDGYLHPTLFAIYHNMKGNF